MNVHVKNIRLVYLISVLFNAVFWMPIWLLYYLNFTDYAGVGLIESFMITSAILSEIPSGAFADLIGKKKTLMLAMLLGSCGEFVMASANGIGIIIVAVVIMSIAYSLYSGTIEALLYDSLLEKGKRTLYPKVIGTQSMLILAATAVISVVGGYIYSYDIRLPFVLTGSFRIIALLFALLLTEPSVDTDKFSLSNFCRQTARGFAKLFEPGLRLMTSLFILVVMLYMIVREVLDDSLIVELGINPNIMGYLYALIYLIASFSAAKYESLSGRFSPYSLVLVPFFVYMFSLIVAPLSGAAMIIVMISLRGGLDVIGHSGISQILNEKVESKERATTLSTFSMLSKLPYILIAYYTGSLIDRYTAVTTSSLVGLFFVIIFAPLLFIYCFRLKKK